MEQIPFTPTQLYLIKMFEDDGNAARLAEVKHVLSRYYAKKAANGMNELWDNGVLDKTTLQTLRHTDVRDHFKLRKPCDA